MSRNIKIPIAISRTTGELVNVKEVQNGLNCNCFCPKCQKDLFAVNQEIKQKAHFRHLGNTDCEFSQNFESYLHWLAKEVFKNIGKLVLPVISSSDLKHAQKLKLQKRLSEFLFKNSLPNFINMHFDDRENYSIPYPENILLQKATLIDISDNYTEKVIQDSEGIIRVDIVALVGDHELFIEPFFTHGIDEIKLKKLQNINTSTISINLLKFTKKYNYEFTKEDFESFLSSDLDSKKWVHIRDTKINDLISNLADKVWPSRLGQIMGIIRNIDTSNKKITEIKLKIFELEQEMQKLTKEQKPFDFNKLFGIS